MPSTDLSELRNETGARHVPAYAVGHEMGENARGQPQRQRGVSTLTPRLSTGRLRVARSPGISVRDLAAGRSGPAAPTDIHPGPCHRAPARKRCATMLTAKKIQRARRLSAIWRAEHRLTAPDVNRLLDVVPDLIAEIDRLNLALNEAVSLVSSAGAACPVG